MGEPDSPYVRLDGLGEGTRSDDIVQALSLYCVVPLDVSLRTAHGYAVVRLSSVEEARCFVTEKAVGGVMDVGSQRATLSLVDAEAVEASLHGNHGEDRWLCGRCGNENRPYRAKCRRCRDFRVDVTATLQVRGMDKTTKERDFVRAVEHELGRDGPVARDIRLAVDKGGHCRGFGFVEFAAERDAVLAWELLHSRLLVGNVQVTLRFAGEKRAAGDVQAAAAETSQPGFAYDEASGMYVDEATRTYYYDPNSGYYYHSPTGKYYYVDQETNAYVEYVAPPPAADEGMMSASAQLHAMNAARERLEEEERRRGPAVPSAEQQARAAAKRDRTEYERRATLAVMAAAATTAPAAPQAASMDRPLDTDNVGRKLLKRMGWSDGSALGAKGGGITEPIRPDDGSSAGKAGLGSSARKDASLASSGQQAWPKNQAGRAARMAQRSTES